MKRIVICGDGTWQSQGTPNPLGVLRVASDIEPIEAWYCFSSKVSYPMCG